MFHRARWSAAVLAVGLVVAVSAGRAAAQPAAIGTYTYSWTDTAGVPLSTATVPVGGTLTVRLRLNEGGGGNLFSVGGVTGYDATATWSTAGIAIPTSGAGAAANPNIKSNPYPAGTGFNGPGGTVTNSNTATVNAERVLNLNRSILSTLDPATFVKSSVAPNAPGSIFLIEVTFAGVAEGTSTLTGGQRLTTNNNPYYDAATATFANYDSAIGTGTAQLMITVAPVPEPATGLLLAATGMAAARFVRRRVRAA